MNDLEERLRGLLDRRAERYPADRSAPAGLLRRARRAAVVTAVVACAATAGVAAGGYFAVAGLRSQAWRRLPVNPALPWPSAPGQPGARRTGPPSPEPKPQPLRSSYTSGGWTFHVTVPLPNAEGALIAAPDALYSAYVEDWTSERGRVGRVDLATGSVTRSRPFFGAINMVMAGGSVWITSGSSATVVGHRSVYQLDPGTLAVRRQVDVSGGAPAAVPGAILAAPAGLWVSNGSELVLLDPTDGAILRRVPVPSVAEPLAIDPVGGLLYVVTHTNGDTSVSEFSERDASTGALVLRVPARGLDLGVTSGAATTGGLWTSVPTGMLGGALFFRRSDLSGSLRVRPPTAYTNGITVSIAAGRLWLEDNMVSKIGCADPTTGELFAQTRVPGTLTRGEGLTDVISTGGALYVGTGAGILRITPSRRCGL